MDRAGKAHKLQVQPHRQPSRLTIYYTETFRIIFFSTSMYQALQPLVLYYTENFFITP
jgi:hypothetical protein